MTYVSIFLTGPFLALRIQKSFVLKVFESAYKPRTTVDFTAPAEVKQCPV
jgi:hypothetical protein